jgi:hypothetical protein
MHRCMYPAAGILCRGFGGVLRPNGEREGQSPLACASAQQQATGSAEREGQSPLACASTQQQAAGSARGRAALHLHNNAAVGALRRKPSALAIG